MTRAEERLKTLTEHAYGTWRADSRRRSSRLPEEISIMSPET
ncbi:MAG: hypothetical protein AAGB97_01575 [Dehalococcoidia bacterium]|nr:hypothetical protein [Chloroflexota bacterium]MBT9160628.1 hypothetical protein [Chloroflexota bacterium]MBT9161838.1 hypothetical protein [Chloroflexota bacterium]